MICIYGAINLFRVRKQLSEMSAPDEKIIQDPQRYVFLFAPAIFLHRPTLRI